MPCSVYTHVECHTCTTARAAVSWPSCCRLTRRLAPMNKYTAGKTCRGRWWLHRVCYLFKMYLLICFLDNGCDIHERGGGSFGAHCSSCIALSRVVFGTHCYDLVRCSFCNRLLRHGRIWCICNACITYRGIAWASRATTTLWWRWCFANLIQESVLFTSVMTMQLFNDNGRGH